LRGRLAGKQEESTPCEEGSCSFGDVTAAALAAGWDWRTFRLARRGISRTAAAITQDAGSAGGAFIVAAFAATARACDQRGAYRRRDGTPSCPPQLPARRCAADMERLFEHFFHFGDGEGMPCLSRACTGSGVVIDGAATSSPTATWRKGQQGHGHLRRRARIPAKVVGADPRRCGGDSLAESALGSGRCPLGRFHAIEVGEWVLAIGSRSASTKRHRRIISGKGKVTRNVHMSASACASNPDRRQDQPGQLGRPLVNLQGEVIGINTLINVGRRAYGFAIPISQATGWRK